MASYQGISRKYRPQNFSAVVGQEAIVTTLKNALRFGKVAQAYLFTGMRGTGKTTLARILAKAVNCEALTEECEPCNRCPSCISISLGGSLDVLDIDGASHRSIEDIRLLNETVGYAPSMGKNKIYLIDEVHMLTKEAFNALLKTLEEPPESAKFFFATTEVHKIPPTIVSRCQRFDLRAIAPEVMKKRLMHITAEMGRECEEKVLDLIIYFSDGALRDAESLLDRLFCLEEGCVTLERAREALGLLSKDLFLAFDNAFAEENLPFAFTFAESFFASGKDPAYCLSLLLEHYRIILQAHMGIFPTNDREMYEKSQRIYTQEQCLVILDLLIAWQEKIAKLPFKRTLVELLLLEILRSKHQLSPAMIVERLIALEEKIHCASDPQNIVQEQKASKTLVKTTNIETKKAEQTTPTEQQGMHEKKTLSSSHYESLMRFASVELEGTFRGRL